MNNKKFKNLMDFHECIKDFLIKNEKLLIKKKIYYNPDVLVTPHNILYNFTMCNKFFSITRYITINKIMIAWENDDDLYVVLYLLHTYYIYADFLETKYQIIVDYLVYTKIDEEFINNLQYKNIKNIDIYFFHWNFIKFMQYEKEMTTIYLPHYKNNDEKNKELKTLEINRIEEEELQVFCILDEINIPSNREKWHIDWIQGKKRIRKKNKAKF